MNIKRTILLLCLLAIIGGSTAVSKPFIKNLTTTDNSTPNQWSNKWQRTSQLTRLSSDDCGFSYRFAATLAIDRDILGIPVMLALYADYQIDFEVSAYSNDYWTFDVETSRKGALYVKDDGGKSANTNIKKVLFEITESGNTTVQPPLGLDYSADNSGNQSSSVYVPFADGPMVYTISGTGPATFTLAFTWNAKVESIAGTFIGGDEASMRMGMPNLSNVGAADYPGHGSRIISQDGHFVSVFMKDCADLYYRYTSPPVGCPYDYGTTKPAAGWSALNTMASAPALPSAVGSKIWIGKANYYVWYNTTFWSLFWNGVTATKFDCNGATGYAGAPIQGVCDFPVTTLTSKEFHTKYKPQPDCQIMELERQVAMNRDSDVIDDFIVSSSVCCSTETIGNMLTFGECWFGLQDYDILDITEMMVFPSSVPIDSAADHSLCAGSCWMAELVYSDPDDNVRELGGIRFTPSSGVGLEAGEAFSAVLAMTGPADLEYSVYSWDAAYNGGTGHWRHNVISIPSGGPGDVIPTLTEWGMIIFCVLLFSWMAWVLVRRRRPAMDI